MEPFGSLLSTWRLKPPYSVLHTRPSREINTGVDIPWTNQPSESRRTGVPARHRSAPISTSSLRRNHSPPSPYVVPSYRSLEVSTDLSIPSSFQPRTSIRARGLNMRSFRMLECAVLDRSPMIQSVPHYNSMSMPLLLMTTRMSECPVPQPRYLPPMTWRTPRDALLQDSPSFV